MSGPSPRQVLYGLVAGGFLLLTVVLTLGAALAGISPVWWSVTLGLGLVAGGGLIACRWRQTGLILAVAIGLLLAWMIGTLVTAG